MLKDEFHQLTKLAIPLAGSYVMELIILFTDIAVVGRLGAEHLAALTLSIDVLFAFLLFPMGILSIVSVYVAQALGKGILSEIRSSTWGCYLISIILSIPFTLLCFSIPTMFSVTGQNEQVVQLSNLYLISIAPSIFPTLLFTVNRNVIAGLQNARIIVYIILSAATMNVVLDIVLVYGLFGFPEFGIVGAGIATTIVSWFVAAFSALWLFNAQISGERLFRIKPQTEIQTMYEIIRVGVPAGTANTLEYGAFAALLVIIGAFGVDELAASEIVFNTLFVVSMICYGLGDAGNVRVSFRLGCEELDKAKQAGQLTFSTTLGVVGVSYLLIWFFDKEIVSLFLGSETLQSTNLYSHAEIFFLLGFPYLLFEGLQVVAARVLRAYKDTKTVMWASIIGHWIIAVVGGYILAHQFELEAIGVWIACILGLLAVAVVLIFRYKLIISKELIHPIG